MRLPSNIAYILQQFSIQHNILLYTTTICLDLFQIPLYIDFDWRTIYIYQPYYNNTQCSIYVQYILYMYLHYFTLIIILHLTRTDELAQIKRRNGLVCGFPIFPAIYLRSVVYSLISISSYLMALRPYSLSPMIYYS